MSINNIDDLTTDPRFKDGVDRFNKASWYIAHDIFEELWHESNGLERTVLQGILQIAVAQLHLEQGNINGATILYGEGLGRLKRKGIPSLGLDIEHLCKCLETRLKLLQHNKNPEICELPFLFQISK